MNKRVIEVHPALNVAAANNISKELRKQHPDAKKIDVVVVPPKGAVKNYWVFAAKRPQQTRKAKGRTQRRR